MSSFHHQMLQGIFRRQLRFDANTLPYLKSTTLLRTRIAPFSQSVLRCGDNTAIDEKYKVTFVTPEGDEITCLAKPGQNLLELAHQENVDLEGACECSLACSTCHVIVEDPNLFDKIPEASDEENDMLDLAFGLTDTSRLGCQVLMSKELVGIRVRIPSATRNMAVDGYKPKPH